MPAISAGIYSPSGVAFDPSGNFYFTTLTRVFRVDRGGQLTVYAGNGALGFSGDGISATAAELCVPRGIAFDSVGNLFIAEQCDRVRRVDAATGMITTVAGNGTAGYSGDGGPAVSATLFEPSGVAVDRNGNLFIADSINARVRRVDANTQIITTVPVSGLANPSAIALDSAGNLFIADAYAPQVLRVDATTGLVTRVAGTGLNGCVCPFGDGGPATSAQLNVPDGLVVDSTGNLFIADTFNYRIRRVDAATQVITTVAGTGNVVPYGGSIGDGGPATSAGLNVPAGVTLDSAGNIFIADSSNFRIRRVDAPTQVITTFAGNGTYSFGGDGGPAASAQLNRPGGVAVDGAGNLFIADTGNQRVRRVDVATGVITTVAGNGGSSFSGNLGEGGPATSAAILPLGVALDSVGNLFIADDSSRVRSVNAATQVITTVAGNGIEGSSGDGGPATAAHLFRPSGVAVDSAGNFFIPGNTLFSSMYRQLRRVDAASRIITSYPGTGIDFGLYSPVGVALDSAGNLFFAARFSGDFTGNNVTFRVDAVTHAVGRVAGGGYCGVDCRFSGDGGLAAAAVMQAPSGVALDSAGNLFITDLGRIRRVDAATQVINTVAGGGSCSPGSCVGFLGDGNPATSAELEESTAVAVDRAGNLFIATGNRIRKVSGVAAIVGISVGPASATVLPGATQQFSASVTNAINTAVTWSLSGTSCTGSSCGTISLQGLYTAPAAPGSPLTVTVTATSAADDTKSASATVSVPAKQASSVTVSSSANPSILGQSVTLTATVHPSSGSATPTGTITFADGPNTLGTVALNSSGSATITVSSFAVAAHQVSMTYSGDNGFFASNGSLTENVSYGICPLYDQNRSVNSGATFPIELYLCDARGNDVSSTAMMLHAARVTSTSGYSGAPAWPGNANPGGNFRFDDCLGPAGGYIFNVKTTGLASGNYSLQFTAGTDPVPHALNFAVR
ncbi:MAG TPA: Ig-like domain repeat protein [Candidatus Acidoferrum sp.]|nr:Ig-like domain repeat protein [Candidatus Acidoferrum sp.]